MLVLSLHIIFFSPFSMPCNFFLVEDMMSQTFGDEVVRYMGLDEASVFSQSALLDCDLPLYVSALLLIPQGDRMVR